MSQTTAERGDLTGADALVAAAAAAGIEVCFANPGTTEMPLVTALDEVPGVRAVLGLQENVCTGAADGYARMAGRPALTLLHLGPGLANGLANLHNARRANTPVVNVVGDHATWHLAYDAPLTSDISALARVVGTVLTSSAAESLAADVHRAVDDAVKLSAVSTLVVPSDLQQAPVSGPAAGQQEPLGPPDYRRSRVPADQVDDAAALLHEHGARVVLLLGGSALSRAGQQAAGRIARLTGAALYTETFPARVERGGGLPDIDRLPYFPEVAIGALAGKWVVLVGAADPVAYFGYAGIASRLAPEECQLRLSHPEEDGEQALLDLAAALGATEDARAPAPPVLPEEVQTLSGAIVGATVAALLPEGAIVSVEGGTCGYPFFTASPGALAHTSLTNTGGAIGQGLPVALGAAIAAPDRPVIALQSDGSALYTVQALWTMARERCNVVVLVAANHVYNVLRTELSRHDNDDLGPQARSLTSLGDPAIDWVGLARAHGVPATRAETVGELADQLRAALAADGPHVVEMVM
jgi:acetolactate synthase-1/2/3 large subunit